MYLVYLAIESAKARAVSTVLTVLAIALSTMLLLGVEKVRSGARSGFEQTVSGADLVVGARSGPINLLLYSIFRLGDPTANVSWATYRAFADRPEVAWTIPLSLGDSHKGYRVLGTTNAYFDHYRFGRKHALTFAAGGGFASPHDAVLGAEAARRLGYEVGDELVIAHGLESAAFAEHDDHAFTATGVLNATGTPVDRTIHVPLSGLEAVHARWRPGAPRGFADHNHGDDEHHEEEEAHAEDLTPAAITAFIVGLESKSAVLGYQRAANTYRREPLTAVIPGVALAQLWRVVSVAENALRAISALVVAAGLTGLLTMMLSSLEARRREVAVLRAVGARRRDIFGLLVLESTLVAGFGAAIGAGLLIAGFSLFASRIEAGIGAPLGGLGVSVYDLLIVFAVTLLGFVIGFVPGWIAYRRSLGDGLAARL